ncbi:hypothetical protein GCM10023187_22340 [Nibrella viscosa]|uniref:Uncharacterized protein n=1 Tax=Nibrella viscosa TaxID=1084524 RepID=A0ABP8KDF7_9BACT
MYVNQSGDVKVAVDKEEGHVVSILLTMPNGQVNASEQIPKNSTALQARFDVKNREDGRYTVKIIDANTVTEQHTTLKTEASVQAVKRTISVL